MADVTQPKLQLTQEIQKSSTAQSDNMAENHRARPLSIQPQPQKTSQRCMIAEFYSFIATFSLGDFDLAVADAQLPMNLWQIIR